MARNYYTRQIVVNSLVLLWGLRITIYLLRRILTIGEDKRFDESVPTSHDSPDLSEFYVLWALLDIDSFPSANLHTTPISVHHISIFDLSSRFLTR